MTKEFKTTLKEDYNLTDTQIAWLVDDLGAEDISLLSTITEQDLVSHTDAKLFQARALVAKLVQVFGTPLSEPQPETSAIPAPPQKIELVLPDDPEKRSLKERLQALKDDSTDDDLLTAVVTHPKYITAVAKTPYVAAYAEDRTLAVADTSAHVIYLQQGQPVDRWNGKRLGTLQDVLGLESQWRKHPICIGEKLYMGRGTGGDWNGIDVTLWKALVWAQTSGPNGVPHSMFPTNPDPVDVLIQLTAPSLGQRWQQILDDFLFSEAHVDLMAVPDNSNDSFNDGGSQTSNTPFGSKVNGNLPNQVDRTVPPALAEYVSAMVGNSRLRTSKDYQAALLLMKRMASDYNDAGATDLTQLVRGALAVASRTDRFAEAVAVMEISWPNKGIVSHAWHLINAAS